VVAPHLSIVGVGEDMGGRVNRFSSCIKCYTVFGGTDQMPPPEPPVGRPPNLVRYFAEATANVP
jgi:hypothetical protein